MEPRISIITLGVSDLARAIRFYRDGLGLPMHDWPSERIAFFTTSGTWLALFPRQELAADATVSGCGEGFPGFTLAHNVGSRGAVDRTLREAQAAGATIVKRAADTNWGGYSGYFSDRRRLPLGDCVEPSLLDRVSAGATLPNQRVEPTGMSLRAMRERWCAGGSRARRWADEQVDRHEQASPSG